MNRFPKGFCYLLAITMMCLVSAAGVQTAYGVNAQPGPMKVKQPDGTELTLYRVGDEYAHWLKDQSGYTVVRDKSDRYVYADLDTDNNRLEPTAYIVGTANPVAARLKPGIHPDVAAIKRDFFLQRAAASPSQAGRPARGARSAPPAEGTQGTYKNLVILCRFSDHLDNMTRSEAEFDVIFNKLGGDPLLAPSGSVRDYYLYNSYGTVTIDSTVVAWVPLPHEEAYYANFSNGAGFYPQSAVGMVEDALNLVDPLIDFGLFDIDNGGNGDGFIDMITFIHSGYDAAQTGDPNNIWSHRFWLEELPDGLWTSDDKNLSGENVKVFDYHTEAAIYFGAGLGGTEITAIGVICHESGHFLGLDDIYDTDNSSSGVGSWGLMANAWGFPDPLTGDFNNGGHYPPHFSAYSKVTLGWIDPITITESGTYSIQQSATEPIVYKIEEGYPEGEYLLIENRQPTGFEVFLPEGDVYPPDALYDQDPFTGDVVALTSPSFFNVPSGGLAIWHIDEKQMNILGRWDNAKEGYPGMLTDIYYAGEPVQYHWPINNFHYHVALLPADGHYQLERTTSMFFDFDFFPLFRIPGNQGDAGDLYSETGANNEIGPSRFYPNPAGPNPNTDGYQGGVLKTGLSTISNISASAYEMTFEYQAPPLPPNTWNVFPNNPEWTIQDAIGMAQEGDVIVVNPGFYPENLVFRGNSVTLRSLDPKNPAIVADTIIDGSFLTIGQDPDANAVITLRGNEGPRMQILGLTLRNGSAQYGAGIHGNGVPATIEYCNITNNQAENFGGGLWGCTGPIRHNTIANNKARSGGAISGTPYLDSYLYAPFGSLGQPFAILEDNNIIGNVGTLGGGISYYDAPIINNRILDNIATNTLTINDIPLITSYFHLDHESPLGVTETSGHGGGLFWCRGYITSNTMTNNRANFGGALYDCGIIENNIIKNNHANYDGGAIFMGGQGLDFNAIVYDPPPVPGHPHDHWMFLKCKVINNVITHNSAGAYGGAICRPDDFTITGNIFTDNSALNGGAIAGGGRVWDDAPQCISHDQNWVHDPVYGQMHGDLIITNNVFARNTAYQNGGAFFELTANVHTNNIRHRRVPDPRPGNNGTNVSYHTGTVLIEENLIEDNVAYASGGAFYNCSGSVYNRVYQIGTEQVSDQDFFIRPQIKRNMIRDNLALLDGGAFAWCDISDIWNNLIFGNGAGRNGGGLFECSTLMNLNPAPRPAGGWWADDLTDIFNNTIYDNHTSLNPEFANASLGGGGLYNCDAVIANDIIWNNTAPTGVGILPSHAQVLLRDVGVGTASNPFYSLINGWSGVGAGNLSLDPDMRDPDNPDRDLRDFHLGYDPDTSPPLLPPLFSQAIDNGTSLSIFNTTFLPFTSPTLFWDTYYADDTFFFPEAYWIPFFYVTFIEDDYDGNPRPVDGNGLPPAVSQHGQPMELDIGAYEFQGPSLTISGLIQLESGAGVPDVTVAALDEDGILVSLSRSTAPDGFYSIQVPYRWSGTVIVSLFNYNFSPPSRSYELLFNGQIDQNYTLLANARPSTEVPPIRLPDFNGDGLADLVLEEGRTGKATLNLTSDDLATPPLWNETYASIWGDKYDLLATGDLNGDGFDDLILKFNAPSNTVYICLMDGSGSGWNVSYYSQGWFDKYTLLGVGDLNGDGRDDLILRYNRSNTVYLCLMEEDGASWDVAWYSRGWSDNYLLEGVGDLNADGRDDLILHRRYSGEVYFCLMNEYVKYGEGNDFLPDSSWRDSGPWEIAHHETWGNEQSLLALADLNGDGRDDMILNLISRITFDLTSPYNPAAPEGERLTWDRVYSQIWGNENVLLGVGDLNGDRRDDLLIRNQGTTTYYSIMDEGGASWTSPASVNWEDISLLGGAASTGAYPPSLAAAAFGATLGATVLEETPEVSSAQTAMMPSAGTIPGGVPGMSLTLLPDSLGADPGDDSLSETSVFSFQGAAVFAPADETGEIDNPWTSWGPVGGPFDPSSKTLAMTNSGNLAYQWEAVPDVTWLTVTPNSGTVNPGQQALFRVTINNAVASLLPSGVYHGTVTVYSLDLLGNRGEQVLYFELVIGAGAQLGAPDLVKLVSGNQEVDGNFGMAVAGVKDLSGDGFGDVIVGAPYENGGLGRVYIIDGVTTEVLHVLESPNPTVGGMFGHSVSGIVDLNGDTFGDILVGAHNEENPGSSTKSDGRAYVFSGADGTLLYTLTAPNTTSAREPNFGFAVAGSPDLNGDGAGDILIGTGSSDPDFTTTGHGAVYVYSGKTGALSFKLASVVQQEGGEFGVSVSGVEDTNDDGTADILVGAAGEYGGEGRAYLYNGLTGAYLLTIVPPQDEGIQGFGHVVSGVPDVTADDLGDLVIGAYASGGRAFVYDGNTGVLRNSLDSPLLSSGDGFGRSLAGLMDINLDGLGDIVVGAALLDGSGANRAYVFDGPTGKLLQTLPTSGGDFGGFGYAVANVPDMTQKSHGGIAVGAWGANLLGSPEGAGVVFLYSGYSALPQIPILPFPPDGAIDVPLNTLYWWNASSRADDYTFNLWEEAVPEEAVMTTTSFSGFNLQEYFFPDNTRFELDHDTTYTWQITASNGSGSSPGRLWTFRTVKNYTPLLAPIGVWASDGTQPGRVQVTWLPVEEATHYQVWRSDTEDAPETLLSNGWIEGESFFDRSAVPEQQYYYWVKAAADEEGFRESPYSWPDPGLAAAGPNTPLRLRDMNGDGRDDMVAQRISQNWTEVRLTNSTATDWTVSYSSDRWQVLYEYLGNADLNADGNADLIFQYNKSETAYLTYMNQSATSWSVPYYSRGWFEKYSLLGIGDFNGDGFDDLALNYNRSATMYIVLLNPPDDPDIWTISYVGPGWSNAFTMLGVGDLNGDGRDDLIVRNNADNKVYFSLMHPGGQSWDVSYVQEWGNFGILGIGDLNGDGRDDFILRDYDATDQVDVHFAFMNEQANDWEAYKSEDDWTGYELLATGDLNGDGRIDLVRKSSDGTVEFDLIRPDGRTWDISYQDDWSDWIMLGGGTGE